MIANKNPIPGNTENLHRELENLKLERDKLKSELADSHHQLGRLKLKQAQLAERLMEEGGHKIAHTLLENLLKEDPGFEKAIMPYGKVCWTMDRVDDVFDVYNLAGIHNDRLEVWVSPNFYEERDKAAARVLPSVLLVTLPKSGSLFLRSFFEKGLSMPWCYIAPPGLLDGNIIPSWVKSRLGKGGAVCQGHPEGAEKHLVALRNAGIHKMVVHVRDVRQAFLSQVHHRMKDRSNPLLSDQWDHYTDFKKTFDDLFENQITFLCKWIEGWLEWADNEFGVEIKITCYEDLVDNQSDFINDMLEFFNIDKELFDFSTVDKKPEAGEAHFRKGLKDEWRDVFSADQKIAANKIISEQLFDFFNWEK